MRHEKRSAQLPQQTKEEKQKKFFYKVLRFSLIKKQKQPLIRQEGQKEEY